MNERRRQTPGAGAGPDRAPSGSPPGEASSAGSTSARQWTSGRRIGTSRSSTTRRSCAVPAGGALQASGGERLRPPTRLPLCSTGMRAPSAKATLATESVSGARRLGWFHAERASPARRLRNRVPMRVTGLPYPSRAGTENGRRCRAPAGLRRLTPRGALTTMCRVSDRCSVRPNRAERGTMASTVGVISAAITCFGDDDHIDDGRTREHLEWIIEGGVHAVIVSGTCGEFSTLSPDERRHLITKFVEWVDGRIPVFAGVMHTSTHAAVSLARHAQEAGATAVMSVSPYYSGPPEREILTYFRDIAGAVDIPLIVYNNPWSSGVSLSVSALATLANEGTAAMIKDSHGDPSRLHDLRALVPASTSLIYGEDFGSFEALLVGADGWVAGVANFMPRRAVRLWDLIAAGKFDEARRHWYDILPLVNITSHKEFFGLAEERPDFIQVYKAALEVLGFPAGGCRRPLLPLTEADATLLKKLIAEGGLARESA